MHSGPTRRPYLAPARPVAAPEPAAFSPWCLRIVSVLLGLVLFGVLWWACS